HTSPAPPTPHSFPTRRSSDLGDYHYVAGGRGAEITGKANLEFNVRHGVKHLTAQMSRSAPGGGWDLDELKRMKDNCDKYGVMFEDRKSTRLNSSHQIISYAVF